MSYNIEALAAAMSSAGRGSARPVPRLVQLVEHDSIGLTNGSLAVFATGSAPLAEEVTLFRSSAKELGATTKPTARIARRLSGLCPKPDDPPCASCKNTGRKPCVACLGRRRVTCGECDNGVVLDCECPRCTGHDCDECDGKGEWDCEDCTDGTEPCDHLASREPRDIPMVAVGPAKIDARAWDMVIALADDESMGVGFGAGTYGDPRFAPVSVFGDGWWAILMPMNTHDEQPVVATFELLEAAQ